MKELIEEAERWDFEPAPASLWWTSTYAFEGQENIVINTRSGQHNMPFEKSFKFLGYRFTQDGRTQESLEERMQSANKAWWRDVKIF